MYEDWGVYQDDARSYRALHSLCVALVMALVKCHLDSARIPRPVELRVCISEDDYLRLQEAAGDVGVEAYLQRLIKESL